MALPETCPMLNLLPLTLLLMLQTPPPSTFNCVSTIDGQSVQNRCEEAFDNLTGRQHRVVMTGLVLRLEIEYQCKGPSSVQVRTEPFALTVDVRELQDGVWHSRGVGRVEWDDKHFVHLANFPKIGGGCSSAKGFSLNRQMQVIPRRGIQHWDHPLPSHGQSG
jgi:hypothetical protein